MKFIKILALIPLLVFSHAEDMYLIKGGITFLPDGSFAKKDILVDEGLIILVEDNIGDVGAENIIDAKRISTPNNNISIFSYVQGSSLF